MDCQVRRFYDSDSVTSGVSQRIGWVEGILEERSIKPESILELQRAVKDIANTVPAQMLRDAAQNVRQRAQACIDASGGLFRYFLISFQKRRLPSV